MYLLTSSSLPFPPSFPPLPPLPLFQDSGDYPEPFYSVQTTSGETISQLIADYIDMKTLKKKPIYCEVEDSEDEAEYGIDEYDVLPKQ